jgi:hypothetical protein
VEISEQIEPQVAGRFALLQCLLKSCEHNKSDVYVAVPLFGVFYIGKPDMLDNIAMLVFRDRLVVEEAQGVNPGIVKFILPALFDKVRNRLADVKEQSAYKMVLLGNLHFHNEAIVIVVRAVQVEHGGSLFFGFVDLLVWEQNYICDFCLQVFPNEGFYEGNEHGFALLRGEDPFENEINDKRSEASWLCKLVLGNGGFFWHDASFEGETEMSYKKAPENGDVESRNIEKYLNLDLQDLRISRIIGNDVKKSGKSFNRDSDRKEQENHFREVA